MPFVNEHSCRLLSPEAVIQCRRTTRISDDKTYHIITCQFDRGKDAWAEQAYRYDINVWSEESAKAHCSKHGGQFEPAQPEQRKYSLEDIPGEWQRKRTIIKTDSSTFIKIEPDPDYPIARQGEIRQRGLEDFEYLLHHIHIEGEKEETHHCLLSDHLANLFERDHLEVNGQTYHIIKGLESNQEVAWTDEQARENQIEPKQMRPGMSFEEKGKEW